MLVFDPKKGNIDDFVKSPNFPFSVIPAKAGIQYFQKVAVVQPCSTPIHSFLARPVPFTAKNDIALNGQLVQNHFTAKDISIRHGSES
jgi:hypothetical protein